MKDLRTSKAILTKDIDYQRGVKLIGCEENMKKFQRDRIVKYCTSVDGKPIIVATVFLALPKDSIRVLPQEKVDDTRCGHCGRKFTKKNPATSQATRGEKQKKGSVDICKECTNAEFGG